LIMHLSLVPALKGDFEGVACAASYTRNSTGRRLPARGSDQARRPVG